MTADQALVGDRLVLHRLLEQSEEKQATSLRTAAIESESELVEIVVEMVGIDGTMVDASHQRSSRAATRCTRGMTMWAGSPLAEMDLGWWSAKPRRSDNCPGQECVAGRAH